MGRANHYEGFGLSYEQETPNGKTNIKKSLDCSVMSIKYGMKIILVKFKFGNLVTIRQFAKFSSLPKICCYMVFNHLYVQAAWLSRCYVATSDCANLHFHAWETKIGKGTNFGGRLIFSLQVSTHLV